jgi:hypothetical protein
MYSLLPSRVASAYQDGEQGQPFITYVQSALVLFQTPDFGCVSFVSDGSAEFRRSTLDATTGREPGR